MARLARVVVPGIPHHITQRGNRRQATFFCDDDYAAYLELMAEWCHEHGVAHVGVGELLARAAVERSIRRGELCEIRSHERTGRPLGDEEFVQKLERTLGPVLHRRKPGRKGARGAN